MASGSVSVDKKVLLFGKTGEGKSTLANMLVSGTLEKPKFTMGDGMDGVTSSCNRFVGRGYDVVDTVGLGEETESERKDAIDLIYKYLKDNQGKYGHIVFVKEANRVDALDLAIWETFKAVFKGAEPAFMVVLTKCEDPKNWEKENEQKLKSIYGERMRFAFVDFPKVSRTANLENARKPERERSLQSLEYAMNMHFSANFQVSYEPDFTGMDDLQMWERSKAIWSIMKPFLKALTKVKNWQKIYHNLWG